MVCSSCEGLEILTGGGTNNRRNYNYTFVFTLRLTARNDRGSEWYAPRSFGATWKEIIKRAGLRHRLAYKSRHTFACWALSAGVNPNFIAAQMVYNVYGKWMNDNNGDQMSILNENFSDYAPYMPPAKKHQQKTI